MWLKFYVSQRMFISLPKRPIYVNYEILCHVFQGKMIDLSAAEIYQLNNTEIQEKELERFLADQNLYTKEKFYETAMRNEKLEVLESELKGKSITA